MMMFTPIPPLCATNESVKMMLIRRSREADAGWRRRA